MTVPILVHHMAALDGQPAPPNSLEAIAACLDAGAQMIEVDINALATDDYILAHEATLDEETTGQGVIASCGVTQARQLHIKHNGVVTNYRAALLSDVVRLMQDCGSTCRLQLDYKNVFPFPSDEPFVRLLKLIAPLGDRVIVSSIADWQLRKLRALSPDVILGFDIQFYLDVRPTGTPITPTTFPRQAAAYGYWDDHPLATRRFWSVSDYLADRCGALVGLVSQINTLFVRHELLCQSLDDGFDWTQALHHSGILLGAWTLDTGDEHALRNAVRLRDNGIDMLTTNTPLQLDAFLRGKSAVMR